MKSYLDWASVATAFGIPPERLITVNQVHGEDIIKIDAQGLAAGGVDPAIVEADAMITNAKGVALGVETADCVPILLYDPVGPAVAAIHAGWRSTVKKIVRKTIRKMHEEFGSDSCMMMAAIGPAIGPECYEVDEPVMAEVRAAFPFWQRVSQERGGGRWLLDLAGTNALELKEAGLDDKNIHLIGLCTACRRDMFYSFRAEGRTGRMLSVIMLTPAS